MQTDLMQLRDQPLPRRNYFSGGKKYSVSILSLLFVSEGKKLRQ